MGYGRLLKQTGYQYILQIFNLVMGFIVLSVFLFAIQPLLIYDLITECLHI